MDIWSFQKLLFPLSEICIVSYGKTPLKGFTVLHSWSQLAVLETSNRNTICAKCMVVQRLTLRKIRSFHVPVLGQYEPSRLVSLNSGASVTWHETVIYQKVRWRLHSRPCVAWYQTCHCRGADRGLLWAMLHRTQQARNSYKHQPTTTDAAIQPSGSISDKLRRLAVASLKWNSQSTF